MRTLIYARYSSSLQNARSIEDQVALLRDRADREGWQVVDVFTDYAISGAAGIGEGARPGLNALLERVEAGGIDQVLAESTDRLARHQGDAFAIRERITYAGARLYTLSDGEVTEITSAFKGLMDAQFRKELGAKIKRGQRGTVAAGRAPAGLAYGYRMANRIDDRGQLVRGLRVVDEEQAAVVVRIFDLFANGDSARAIAARLNREGVKGPGGRPWRLSTIYGDRKRQNGMLANRLYRGELVFNRTSKIVDPRTRKPKIRPNPESEWIVQPAPDLRIVSDELWHRVQARRDSDAGQRPEQCRRPKHMLSGLGVCGECGSGWILTGGGYWGCSGVRAGLQCGNGRTIKTESYEARVLAGLEATMLDPDLVAAYVAEYHRDFARRAAELGNSRGRLERQLRDATAKVGRLVRAIGEGGGEFAEIRAALAEAKATRDAVQLELDNLEALPVIALHPRIVEDYRRQVAELGQLLGSDEGREEVVPILRNLIERVVLTPRQDGRGVDLTVEGRLASILALASGQPMPTVSSITMERVKRISRYRTVAIGKG